MMSRPDDRRGTALMTMAMAISGTIGWFVLESGLPTVDVVFWRCVFGALALSLACWRLGHFRKRLSVREASLAAAGGVAIVGNWLLLFAAFPRSTISVATAVYNVQPFILFGLGVVFLGERFTAARLGWLLLAFAGLLFVVGLGAADLDIAYLTGIAMAFGAATLWAVAAFLTKRLSGTPPHLIAFVHVVVGAIALGPLAHWSAPPVEAWTWSILAIIGVVHTGLVYIMMYEAVQRLPTHLQGALSFIYPVVAILVDVLALGHRLTLLQVIGIVAILAAAAGMAGLFARRSIRSVAGEKADSPPNLSASLPAGKQP